MKSIVAKVFVVLSIIFVVISICGISSVDCIKAYIPLENAIISNNNIIRNIMIANIKGLPYKQIPFFYIALIFVILSSVISFTQIHKAKSIINIVISLVPTIFVLITHNYIWFIILMNMYLLLYIFVDYIIKTKVNIAVNIVAVLVCMLNLVQAVKHLNLEFDSSNVTNFERTLIAISKSTLNIFKLWIIPYTILLIKDIIATYKISKTVD